MIELDKTPLKKEDIGAWELGIDRKRLRGVVEGLKEELCVCHLYKGTDSPRLRCNKCRAFKKFFGVLK